MQRNFKRSLELQIGRSLTESEYGRVADKMKNLRRLTMELKAAFKNDPEQYDMLVWQVIGLSNKIILEVS